MKPIYNYAIKDLKEAIITKNIKNLKDKDYVDQKIKEFSQMSDEQINMIKDLMSTVYDLIQCLMEKETLTKKQHEKLMKYNFLHQNYIDLLEIIQLTKNMDL